jgi:cell division protein FtsQ
MSSITIKRKGGARPKVASRSAGRNGKARSPRSRPISAIDKFFRALPISAETLQRILTWGIVGMVIAGLVAALYVTGIFKALSDETVQMVGDAGFRVERVEVVGADRVDTMKVYDIALNQKSRSMAAVDLDALRTQLLTYGWIADARITRRLPDTLVIDIVERTPAAVWQHDGKLALIDAKGVVLEQISAQTMPDLPLVIGANANQQAAALHDLLAEAQALKPLLAGATWIGNRRWDLRFETGEILALPAGEKEAAEALVNFARMDGVNRLLGRGIARFDMRNPDKMVLRRKSGTDSSETIDVAAANGQGG